MADEVNVYETGSIVNCNCQLNFNGAATDPFANGCFFYMVDPSGVKTTYQYPTAPQILKIGTGAFQVQWPVVGTNAGYYTYSYQLVGPGGQVQKSRTFLVKSTVYT